MSSSPNSSSSSERAPEFRPFYDVVCNIDIVLGTGSMSVREVLQLRKHSVVRLAQSAGADLQVLVNGVAVANGEVVIVDDSTSIRITEIAPAGSSDHVL
jgi:flagellar motor switch protein FliN/FliY